MAKRHSTTANGNGKRIPAVGYIRMSSDGQEASPSQQREEIAKLAELHHCHILRWYQDLGISGDATHKRSDFRRMVTDAEQLRDFRAILCWDQDRFGRFDSIEAGHWIYPLRKANVRLITCCQGVIDWSDFTGRVMYTITQEGKHQYLRDLARNSGRGILAARRDGRWTGQPPFGYRIGPDGYLIFGPPDEVAAVREMFAMRARGCSYFEIARAMNAKGVKPPRGSRWCRATVTQLLTRKTYLGMVPIGDNPQAKYHRMVAEPEYTENAHPAIIDRQTWDIVQAMRRKPRKAHTRRESRGAPLAGLLVCGRCQAPMYSTMHRGRQKRNHIYHCGTNHQGLGCGYCAVPQAATLTMVADAIRKHVLGGSLDALEQEIQRQMANLRKQTSDAAKLGRQLKTLDQKLDRAAARILEVADSLVPRVEAQMLEMQKQRKAIEAQLKATSQPPTEDAKSVAARLWRLDGILRNEDPVEVRAALGHIVERIVLDFEPAGRNKRGRQYRFSGGRIELCTEGATSSA